MVPLFIFTLHIIAFTAAFTVEYQKEGTNAGILNVLFVALIFSVGWSISSFVLKYLIDDAGFGPMLNRDALSLLVLSAGEVVFYWRYYKEDRRPAQG